MLIQEKYLKISCSIFANRSRINITINRLTKLREKRSSLQQSVREAKARAAQLRGAQSSPG
jgi:hypothetical protein